MGHNRTGIISMTSAALSTVILKIYINFLNTCVSNIVS